MTACGAKCAVTATTGTLACSGSANWRRRNSQPSMTGMCRSSNGRRLQLYFRSRLAAALPRQMTTDGHRSYLEAVEAAFGADIDYAMLVKLYGNTDDPKSPERRYSPAKCIGTVPTVITGRPDPQHISTSFVERLNWTARTTMRRYTRLSNGFSRKIENHMAAVVINYFAYNFIKIHRTLRVTPAMAAGVTNRLLDVSDLVNLLVESESKKAA